VPTERPYDSRQQGCQAGWAKDRRRARAGRPFRWAVLAAILAATSSAWADPPPSPPLPSSDVSAAALYESVDDEIGMIGPTGPCTESLLPEPEALLSDYLSNWQPASEPMSGPSDVSDWILDDNGPPSPDVQYMLGRGRWLPGPIFGGSGPVRQGLHALFGGPPASMVRPQEAPPRWRGHWRFRPFRIGWFMGAVSGGPLLEDWVNQKSGYFAGYRIGWDYTPYWGCEVRIAFGWIELADSQRAIEAQEAADAGLAPDDPFRDRFDQRRDSDMFLGDISLLWYPWGGLAWRPYLSAGLGAARIDFIDRLSVRYAETVFAVPLAAGVKRRWCDWLALRFDVTDNIAFGQSFDTVHNLSFTVGVEVLFGGTRTAYWPWNPGRHYW